MSGYDQIKLAQKFARERKAEYKRRCVGFLHDFCDDFAKYLGVDTCGRDRRIGATGFTKSDDKVSCVDPPFFEEEDALVWTDITIRTDGTRRVGVGVWCNGDSFWIKTAEGEFESSEREQVFLHIKNLLVEREDDLDFKRDWLA